MKKEITVLLCNHFDLTWRRCLYNPIDYKNMRWISYSEIQKFYIKRCLAMCEKDSGFCFSIESPFVLREYLKKAPEDKKKITSLMARGRIDVPFTGDNIVDSNLVQGESIVRNFLYGSRYMKECFGQEGKCAYRRDAFGNSAQLPQILRQFGMEWVWGLSYTEPDAPVWVGLDGARICCMEPPSFAESGSIDKYAPCSSCGGTGERKGHLCPECEGRGINWKESKFRLSMPESVHSCEPYSVWTQRSEELIPPMEMLDWPKQMKKRLAKQGEEEVDISFGGFNDVYERMREQISSLLQNPETPMCGPELNPNNTGVYASRAALKKLCRECEEGMAGLEHALILAEEEGRTCPYEHMERLWQQMFFLMFHDAVTGTVVDAAYEELLERGVCTGAEIEARTQETLQGIINPLSNDITIWNPGLEPAGGLVQVRFDRGEAACDFALTGQEGRILERGSWKEEDGSRSVQLLIPPVGPMRGIRIQCIPLRKQTEGNAGVQILEEQNLEEQSGLPKRAGNGGVEYRIENARYCICADDHGLKDLYDKKSGLRITETDGLRLHDVLLEHDEGSPWTTLCPERSRESMSARTRLVGQEKTEIYERLTFQVSPFNVNTVEGVEYSWTVTLVKDSDRIDFSLDMQYWDTYNQRIRVAFPVPVKGRHLYEIPYGVIERKPYESKCDRWDNASGDWPAVRWAGVSGEASSAALMNYGNPSYLIEEGESGSRLFLTLLRSPCVPTYLHEPRSYVMKEYDGMRDSGRHRFSYSLVLYDSALENSSVIQDAAAFSTRLQVLHGTVHSSVQEKLPSWSMQARAQNVEREYEENATVHVTAFYPDKDGAQYMRLVEFWGRKGKAMIRIPADRNVTRCRLDGTAYGPEKPVLCSGQTDDGMKNVCLELEPFEITTLRLERTWS